MKSHVLSCIVNYEVLEVVFKKGMYHISNNLLMSSFKNLLLNSII